MNLEMIFCMNIPHAHRECMRGSHKQHPLPCFNLEPTERDRETGGEQAVTHLMD